MRDIACRAIKLVEGGFFARPRFCPTVGQACAETTAECERPGALICGICCNCESAIVDPCPIGVGLDTGKAGRKWVLFEKMPLEVIGRQLDRAVVHCQQGQETPVPRKSAQAVGCSGLRLK